MVLILMGISKNLVINFINYIYQKLEVLNFERATWPNLIAKQNSLIGLNESNIIQYHDNF